MSVNVDRVVVPAPSAVKPFKLPAVERSQLANGLTVLTARQDSLPLLTLRLVLNAGAALEPPDRAGLAHFVSHALETGTAKRDAAELAWELESAGTQLQVSSGWDGVALSVTVPSHRFERALEVIAEMVREPAFPPHEMERLRGEQLGEIMQRGSDPRSLANDVTSRFIYSTDSPFARTLWGTPASVSAFDQVLARAWWQQRYSPSSAALVVVGDLGVIPEGAIERAFADWQQPETAGHEINVEHASLLPEVHIIDRPGSVQSELRFGHVGLPRRHPDFFPVTVMNSILGGAFTSRLNLNLREKNGFTYGVRSVFHLRRAAGPFVIQTAVSTDVTARAVTETLNEIRALREEGATQDEVQSARDYMAGILPLELQTTGQVAGRLAELFMYNLPDDYYRTYPDRINAVRVEDVQAAAVQHIHPDQLAIVVVGDAAKIEAPLRELGFGTLEVHSSDD